MCFSATGRAKILQTPEPFTNPPQVENSAYKGDGPDESVAIQYQDRGVYLDVSRMDPIGAS